MRLAVKVFVPHAQNVVWIWFIFKVFGLFARLPDMFLGKMDVVFLE
jgi:hypothetical protein